MKLVVVSLSLFFIMKMIYGYWGDYESDQWAIAYYIPLYLVMVSFMRYMRISSYTRLQRQFFGMGLVYFTTLIVVHLICIFKINLYYTLIEKDKHVSAGMITLFVCLFVINYLRLKSHDREN